MKILRMVTCGSMPKLGTQNYAAIMQTSMPPVYNSKKGPPNAHRDQTRLVSMSDEFANNIHTLKDVYGPIKGLHSTTSLKYYDYDRHVEEATSTDGKFMGILWT